MKTFVQFIHEIYCPDAEAVNPNLLTENAGTTDSPSLCEAVKPRKQGSSSRPVRK
jgi:hypothetical protein